MAIDSSSPLSVLGIGESRVATTSGPPNAVVDDTRTFQDLLRERKLVHREGDLVDRSGPTTSHPHATESSGSGQPSTTGRVAETAAGVMVGSAGGGAPFVDHTSVPTSETTVATGTVHSDQSSPWDSTVEATGRDTQDRHGLETRDSARRSSTVVANVTPRRGSTSTGSSERRGTLPPSSNARGVVGTTSTVVATAQAAHEWSLTEFGDAKQTGSPGSFEHQIGSMLKRSPEIARTADHQGLAGRVATSQPSRGFRAPERSSSLESSVSMARFSPGSQRIGSEVAATNSPTTAARRLVPITDPATPHESEVASSSHPSRLAGVHSIDSRPTSTIATRNAVASTNAPSVPPVTILAGASAPSSPSTSGTSSPHAQAGPTNIDLSRFVADVSHAVGSPGDYRVSLSLHPESLGTVRATLSLSGNDLSVAILPDSHRGHEALVRELDALRTELARGGLSVNVTLHDHGASRGQRETNQFARDDNASIAPEESTSGPASVHSATQIHVIL